MKKHVIITGGAGGIGRAIALAFLEQKHKVTIIDIDKASGENLAKEHEGLHFFHGDIGEKHILEKFIETAHLPVDFLINNACLSRGGVLSNCSYEDFEYTQRVGVTAPYYLVSLLLKREGFRQGGAIVNIASTRAWQSQPNTESYTAAKGGIVALTHALAVSLANRIRVNCISPGWIDTQGVEHSDADKNQHPAGRVGKPDDIAQMALFLCSDQAGFINGQDIVIDGGMSKNMIYHGDGGWTFK